MPHKAHLLIVDDEANTLASLSRAFRLAGHEAMVCDNAAKALELARLQSFDLIMSDVVMPGKDGLALLEELKAQGIATPVVMMSGQAHIDMAVRATQAGCAGFSGETDLYRQASADSRERAEVAAAGIGKPAAPPAPGKTRNGVDRRNHEKTDGPDRTRGRK